MWLLLQPRGLLGGIFLYLTIAAGVIGVVMGGFSGANDIQQPFFKGWEAPGAGPLFPFLFITVACGACSGFHAIVASGTTSKQVAREADVKPVAYGAMLLEAMVAVFALATFMLLPTGSSVSTPDAVFAQGIGRFLAQAGVPAGFAVTFGLLAFSTFIFDTLDVCTRLGRYVWQELTGWKGSAAGAAATAATLVLPLAYLWFAPADAWRQFWILFGTSNQLLAALTLVGLAVWFRSRGRNPLPVLLPAVVMLAVTGTALARNLSKFYGYVFGGETLPAALTPATAAMNLGVAAVLAVLGIYVTAEALRVFRRPASA
jgi:carbon starvation protein